VKDMMDKRVPGVQGKIKGEGKDEGHV